MTSQGSSDRSDRIRALFDEVVGLEAEDRAARLAEACGGDEDLRREVESLLEAADARSSGVRRALEGLQPAEEASGKSPAASGSVEGDEVPAALQTALADRYRIVREIGRGGMATVYLADDLKHPRQVAIKVLNPDLSEALGAERFLQEIETAATLTHPHILPLFDSGEAEGFLFYVMPLVEGGSLRERLAREKQLPVDEAVRIASAVAGALQAAHEQGVIHRDVKPGNILLHRREPMVADFGIAVAASMAAERLTETGVSLGTPWYMSPEQAAADRELSAASDVYALGCVLYEMLIGEPPFTGATTQAVLASVLTADPPRPREHRQTVPVHVEDVVLKSLARLPADRFATAADFARALAEPGFRSATRTMYGPAAPGGSKRWTAALAAAVVVLTVALVRSLQRDDTPPPVTEWEVVLPSGAFGAGVDIAPAGHRIAFTVADEGETWIAVRDIGSLDLRALPGTEGGTRPFLSPDGAEVAFVADGELRRLAIDGGAPISLAPVPGQPQSGVWGANDTLYYSYGEVGFYAVPASGGTPTPLERPSIGLGGLRALQHLHDISSLLAVSGGRIGLYSLEGGGWRFVEDLLQVSFARLVPTGHVVFTQGGGLWAAKFDERAVALIGRPVPLGRSVPSGSAFEVSRNGTLVYGAGTRLKRLVWVDRNEEVTYLPAEPRNYGSPRLSPDGNWLVAIVVEPGRLGQSGQRTLLFDLASGASPRLLTHEGVRSNDHAWSPDSRRIAFAAHQPATAFDIWETTLDSFPESWPLWTAPGSQFPHSWSPDGNTIAFYETDDSTYRDIWMLAPGRTPEPWLRTSFNERSPMVSPDGRWVAFVTNETGEDQVWVAEVADAGTRKQVSKDGATSPLWTRGGRELVYRRGDAVYAIEIDASDGVRAGEPVRLFSGSYAKGGSVTGSIHYDVTAGGDRFLMIEEEADAGRLVVVQNWLEELKAAMSGGG